MQNVTIFIFIIETDFFLYALLCIVAALHIVPNANETKKICKTLNSVQMNHTINTLMLLFIYILIDFK